MNNQPTATAGFLAKDTTTPNHYQGRPLPPTRQIRCYHGNYASFCLSDNQEGLIDREGRIVFMPDEPSFLQHSFCDVWEVTPLNMWNDCTHQVDAANGFQRLPYYFIPQTGDHEGDFLVRDIPNNGWSLTSREHFRNGYACPDPFYNRLVMRGDSILTQAKEGKPWTFHCPGRSPWRFSRIQLGSPAISGSSSFGGKLLKQGHSRRTLRRHGGRAEWCIVREDRSVIRGPHCDYMEGFAPCGRAIAHRKGFYCLLDTTGHPVATIADTYLTWRGGEQLFDQLPLYWCTPELLCFCEKGLRGIMDKDGRVLTEPRYKRVHAGRSGRLLVKTQDDRWSYVTPQGEELFPGLGITYIMHKQAGVYSAHDARHKWGILREDGTWLLPMEYDHISYESLGEVSVTKDGRHFVLNLEA